MTTIPDGTINIGIIGLGIMGSSLARNIANRGYTVAVNNRTHKVIDEFIEKYQSEKLLPFPDLKDFVAKLEKPRKIILMITAGKPIDEVIGKLMEFIEPGDIIIDAGNTEFKDSERRYKELNAKGIKFLGIGISGGKLGALNGPSIMVGGSESAWDEVKVIFETISARDFQGRACCNYFGSGGAGHFVKMIHNGIEYGMLEIIAESYDILKTVYRLPPNDIAEIFSQFNNGRLSSYLLELAPKILTRQDDFEGGFLINKVLDVAEQRGSGIWTAFEELERNVAAPTFTESVNARFLSNYKNLRVVLNNIYTDSKIKNSTPTLPLETCIELLESAIYFSWISIFAQGLHLLDYVQKANIWNINFSEVIRIWEGGSIIRCKLLKNFEQGFKLSHSEHLFVLPEVSGILKSTMEKTKNLIAYAIQMGVCIPAFSSSFNYFDAITERNLPSNLIQAMRDAWGGHHYQRIDKEGYFTTKWD